MATSEVAMFFDLDIKADRLAPKTICLTYDDGPGETPSPGPGPRTRGLGRYLFEQGIQATFFMLGQHIERYPSLPRELRAWGHLVGNHTYSHPCLERIERIGRGILLMHDSSEDPAIRANNQTAEATRLLVQALTQRGYRFIRLDAIPQVQSATRVSALIQLRSAENRMIVRADDD